MASPCNTPIRGYIYSIIYLNILHATFPRLIPRGIALSIPIIPIIYKHPHSSPIIPFWISPVIRSSEFY